MPTLPPVDLALAYLAAVLLVVISPGPDNILAISRGLGQGRLAAALWARAAGLGFIGAGVSVLLLGRKAGGAA